MHELLLEGPHRRRRAGAHAGLLVDVLDVVADGLHGDPECVADRLIGVAVNEREGSKHSDNVEQGKTRASLSHAARPEKGQE